MSENIGELVRLAKILGKYGVVIGRVAVYIHTGKIHYITTDIDANIPSTGEIEKIVESIVRELENLGYDIPEHEVKDIIKRLNMGSIASIELNGIKIVITVVADEEYEYVEIEGEKIMVKPALALLKERLDLLDKVFEETYALDVVVLLEELHGRGLSARALRIILNHPNLPVFVELVDTCIMNWRHISHRIPEDQRDYLLDKLVGLRQLLAQYL